MEEFETKYTSEHTSFLDILGHINRLFFTADAIVIELRNYSQTMLIRSYFSHLKQIWENMRPIIKLSKKEKEDGKDFVIEMNKRFDALDDEWINWLRNNDPGKDFPIRYFKELEDLNRDLFTLKQELRLHLAIEKKLTDDELLDKVTL